MNNSDLRAIETTAAELAMKAGEIIMGFFSEPLQVQYKSDSQRSPVTDADKAANEYIKQEISRRFPGHGILSEEDSEITNASSDVLWVIDPLDGTTNFLNQLPVFGVSIAVLEKGSPVVGAIFVPSIHTSNGSVIHARVGGGAFENGLRLSLETPSHPRTKLLAAVPAYFWRIFRHRRGFRSQLGDLRSTGSVAYEMAMVTRSVFHYAIFAGPWIWDVAAGILLVQEAGGTVKIRDTKTNQWVPFTNFNNPYAIAGGIREWRGSLILGSQEAVESVSSGIQQHRFRFRRAYRRLRKKT